MPSIRIKWFLGPVEQWGLGTQEIRVTGCLRLVNILSTSLLLLPLNELAEQLSLCGQHFRKARQRGWQLLRSAAACMPKTVRIAMG